LTDKQKKEYVDSDGVHCPYCHSTDIEGGSVNVDAGTAWQEISCIECGESWQDVYMLTSIEED